MEKIKEPEVGFGQGDKEKNDPGRPHPDINRGGFIIRFQGKEKINGERNPG